MDTSAIPSGDLTFARPAPELVLRFAAIPAANIGDAQDRLGVMDSAIAPIWAGARICGPAFPILTRPGDNLAIHAALAAAHPGDVLVVSGGANEQRALIGELIGGRAKALGFAGFIIDGAVRDAEGLEEYAMPVFARAVTPAGPYKNGPGKLAVPIAVGGVPVLPGDLVVADADGVVVVAQADLTTVVAKAEAVRDGENLKREAIELDLGLTRA